MVFRNLIFHAKVVEQRLGTGGLSHHNSYLTTRLWDAYLPDWRKDSKNVVDVPQEIKDALKELIEKYQEATAAEKSTAVRGQSRLRATVKAD